MTKSYFKGASAALLVYDVTQETSLNELNEWIRDVREMASEKIIIALVANKIDLLKKDETYRAKSEGKEFAERNFLDAFF